VPDFSADFSSGTTLEEWSDPDSVSTPSRLNVYSETPPLRAVGTTGVQVEITATVPAFGGVVGEVDANLGGRLFALHFAEVPSLPPPAISNPAGQTSVQRFTPPVAGHYSVRLERIGATGGSVFLHVDVQDP